VSGSYLYLWLNLFTIALPLAFSFYSPAPFYKKWKHLWISTLIPAVIFILWDEYFTQLGIWGFNPKYLSGIYVGSLPLEEILFFFCIPYACVFTYHALGYLVKTDWLRPYQKIISLTLVIALLVTGVLYYNRLYTTVTFISTGSFILVLYYNKTNYWLGRFYFSFIVILIPFFIINGILTGSWIEGEVVWYNNNENLGIRLGTIPIEDTIYGMLLLIMNVSIFEHLQQKHTT
jgi:lycopene cyclase domain-containing protein